jgi:hypothetical protein
MKMLMITWTDVFEGLGNFFQWIFKGMRMLGQGPNIIIWLLVIGGIFYWTMRLNRYKKESQRNGTVE